MTATVWCSFLGDSSFAALAALMGPHATVNLSLAGAIPPAALARWVQARTGRVPGRRAPDLGEVVEGRGLAGAARDDLRRFRDLLAPRRSAGVVGRCAVGGEGHFAVAFYRADGPVGQVRVGDTFLGGVQMSGHVASGVVLVEPHVLRRVCVNGASVPVASDEGVYARWSEEDVEGDLEEVVETALSGRLVRDVAADLARAARTPMPALSDLRARGLLRVDDGLAASIAVAARAEEPTLFGLYNAVTRVARDTSDLRRAVALERAAGRLVVARLRTPDRDPAGARVPAADVSGIVSDTERLTSGSPPA